MFDWLFGKRKHITPTLYLTPLTDSEVARRRGFSEVHEERIGLLPPKVIEAIDKYLTDEADAAVAKDRPPQRDNGHIYVLINPSMPGLVKIGWTSGTSEERAQQLSAVTGVAANFAVAYDEAVADPAEAERRVHQELAKFRYNRNREFFKISVKAAIATVGKICDHINSQHQAASEADKSQEWDALIMEAENCEFGWCGVTQDMDRAVELYQKIAALGSSEAFVKLAELHASGALGEPNLEEALSWLEKGADADLAICYYELARLYLGEHPWDEEYIDPDRAIEWFQRCFKQATINEANEYALFVALRRYLKLIVAISPTSDDLSAGIEFKGRFVRYLSSFGQDRSYIAKRQEVHELFANIPQVN